jgi:diguanylate cyclase (GGDEF)-like protein/PAS domain S-box-containing protein
MATDPGGGDSHEEARRLRSRVAGLEQLLEVLEQAMLEQTGDLERAVAELQGTVSLLGAMFDATADGILVVDTAGRITNFNERFREMWGLSASTLAGATTEAVLPVMLEQLVDPAAFMRALVERQAHPEKSSFATLAFKDGRVFERSVIPQRLGDTVVGHVISLSDVTERQQAEAELQHAAQHDPLTRLPNRVLFLDRLGRAVARLARRRVLAAVLFCDLDGFKDINDSLGHDHGDNLLVTISTRLASNLRPSDTVARFGGDEFVVLGEDLQSEQDGVRLAERLSAVVAEPIQLGDQEVSVSASIGIVFARDASADPGMLIRDADAAMYVAKAKGGPRIEVFDPAVRRNVVRRMQTGNALRRALERDELRLFYQPIVHLGRGTRDRVVGAEALIRWNHPELGLVASSELVPLAEETGLILPIGEWVLRTACRQAEEFRCRGWPLQMSVNLSPRQLAHPGLLALVEFVLREVGVDPAMIQLEITETAAVENMAAVIQALEGLKSLGLKLALDDFGTGYSSPAYLHRFPIDALKIDRTFVVDLGSAGAASVIAGATINLAHALGLTTVAEAVETAEQLRSLRRLECDTAQGYFWSRPVPAEDLLEWLGRTSPEDRGICNVVTA